MSKFPVLQTDRLVLREFRKSDALAVFDIFSRDIVTKYHNAETMQSIEQAEKMVAVRTSLFERALGIRWGIALREQMDVIIGSCGYYNLNKPFRSAEIGYDLHPAHWRQGIMTEALTAAIQHGFGEGFFFHLNRIEALTCVDHEASAGLLKRLGFEEEGVRREYGYWKGRFHDLRSFSLLREDWAT
ncbi:MAG TPA: GNAT family N-acetyltransferase [Anaerolineae bacterium]|nr:GNAT family N-acetyltransferase [Anaerolineae bacterium]